MHFLVAIDADFPADLGEQQLAEIRGRERERGLQLRADRTIMRIWRVTGSTANVGIWQAADEATLRSTLETLPIFPWASIEVTPLSLHPLEAEGVER